MSTVVHTEKPPQKIMSIVLVDCDPQDARDILNNAMSAIAEMEKVTIELTVTSSTKN